MKNKTKWHVEDWAGNVMNWGEYKTFDDAYSAICERFDSDEDIQEYYVIESEEV